MIDLMKLKLSIDSLDSDNEDLQELTILLRDELGNLEIEKIVSPSDVSQPNGTKSPDAISWGQLLITLAASGGVLTTLISAINAWVLRQSDCMIKMELDGDTIELNGIDSKVQKKLIDDFLARHPMEDI